MSLVDSHTPNHRLPSHSLQRRILRSQTCPRKPFLDLNIQPRICLLSFPQMRPAPSLRPILKKRRRNYLVPNLLVSFSQRKNSFLDRSFDIHNNVSWTPSSGSCLSLDLNNPFLFIQNLISSTPSSLCTSTNRTSSFPCFTNHHSSVS